MATVTLSTGLAFLGGVLTVLSPCILPILPILIGRSLQSHRFGPVALVAGLVGGFAGAGSLLGIASQELASLMTFLRFLAIAILLILGFLAIFPEWGYRLMSRLPRGRSPRPGDRAGWLGEFWLGTQLGLLWVPCAGPVLGGILVLAAVEHEVLGAFGLLTIFGTGAALPMLAIAYGGRTVTQRLLKLRAHSATLQRVGGVMIVFTAIAILLGWDTQVQLWLAPIFPPLTL